MRKILVLSVFLLCSCETLGITQKPDCFKSVAISKVAIEEAFDQAADASEKSLISVENAKKALTILDSANELSINAGALCEVDEKTAFDYLSAANKSVSGVLKIVNEGNSNE